MSALLSCIVGTRIQVFLFFFFSSRRRHTRYWRDWSSDVWLFRSARLAKPVLLEPVMAVEVVTPQDFLGDVIGDLSRRRGRVEGQEPRGNALAVKASVPLAEMFGYATDLRSNTQGRANYTLQFDRYEEVPASIAEGIVGGRGGEPVAACAERLH